MVDKFLDSLIKFDIAIEEFELADDAPHILKDEKIEVIYKGRSEAADEKGCLLLRKSN